MNALHRLYERMPELIRRRSGRIGSLTVVMAGCVDGLPERYGLAGMKELTAAILEGCKYHDVGLLLTPPLLCADNGSIRCLPGELQKQHPLYSGKVVQFLGDEVFERKQMPVIQDICRYHHERYDGGGYPYGLEKDEIPLVSALCGMAYEIDRRLAGKSGKGEKQSGSMKDFIAGQMMDWYSLAAIDCFLQVREQIFEFYYEDLNWGE